MIVQRGCEVWMKAYHDRLTQIERPEAPVKDSQSPVGVMTLDFGDGEHP